MGWTRTAEWRWGRPIPPGGPTLPPCFSVTKRGPPRARRVAGPRPRPRAGGSPPPPPGLLPGAAVARESDDATLVDLIDPAQPIEVLVEQEHLGFHALRDPCRVPTDVARTEHDDARGTNSGHSAEEDAAAAELTLEEPRAHLCG